jgi:hypothetical protein
MTVQQLISDNPKLHSGADGGPANFAVAPSVLRAIAGYIKPGMRTLETGSGHTTIVFAMGGAEHTSISPYADEQGRIGEYLAQHGIAGKVQFLTDSSDIALTKTDHLVPEWLDFVFIDGAHRYPFPCIDYHFTEGRIKVGGILCVDDVHMPSVRILYDFLRLEKCWELDQKIKNTAFFRRVAPTVVVSDWQAQGINASYKQMSEWKGAVKRSVKKMLSPFYTFKR